MNEKMYTREDVIKLMDEAAQSAVTAYGIGLYKGILLASVSVVLGTFGYCKIRNANLKQNNKLNNE